jgi:hypothetical protein
MRFLFAFVLGGVLSLQIPAVADLVSQVAAYAMALLPVNHPTDKSGGLLKPSPG